MDLTVEYHGSLALVRAHNEDSQEWLDQAFDSPETQWSGPALVVEPRFIESVVAHAEASGLLVQ